MSNSYADLSVRRARDLLRGGDREAAIAAIATGYRLIEGEVLSLLRDGLDEDALRRLELWCEPKWLSAAACAEDYENAMGGRS